MGILTWIILGLIAGFIGSKLVNKTGQGMVLDIVLGIVGAVVGGFIASAIGLGGVTGFNLWSILVAVARRSGRVARLSDRYRRQQPLTAFAHEFPKTGERFSANARKAGLRGGFAGFTHGLPLNRKPNGRAEPSARIRRNS